MIVGFLVNDLPRERLLADAVIAGARRHGDAGWAVPKAEIAEPAQMPDADVVCMCGVKSLDWFAAVHARQAHALLFDKGYSRHLQATGPRVWEYWRVALDAHQPTGYMMDRPRTPERWLALGETLRPWRARGAWIVVAGSSAKYHRFAGLVEPTEYYARLCRKIGNLTEMPVVYRPKPTWKEAVPVERAAYSPPEQPLAELLDGAWCLVTHGSNAAVDAVLAGVPTIVLGGAPTRPISATEIEAVTEPRLALEDERLAWASALAWCQWTRAEIARGEMWADMRSRIL